MQTSRWRAQIHSPMEENSCGVLTRRIHQPRPRVDKDNPTGQIQKARNQSKDHEQRRGSATHTKLGTYLYGIFILCGLVIKDQKESLRRKYGYKAGNSINPMIGHMVWFWYEWLHIDNIKLIGIFIGVAIIVPTALLTLHGKACGELWYRVGWRAAGYIDRSTCYTSAFLDNEKY